MKITQFRLTLQTFHLLEELYYKPKKFSEIKKGSRTALSQLIRRAQSAGLVTRTDITGEYCDNGHSKYLYYITDFGILLFRHVIKYMPDTYVHKLKEEKK